ncbi:L-xylulose reductase-like [Ptychodera flava]|uniref:L-xylulose reductase-like n=1 Tax=Ptychodera flava TaxID=63121 RepID=UPI003969DF4E
MVVQVDFQAKNLISSPGSGSIVNVSSVNSMRPSPGVLVYNMSKAAVDQFTNCITIELASKQIRVNSINPGVIVTEIHKRAGMDYVEYKKFLEHSKTTHALGRPGQVDEVAKAIAFLASDDSSFITATQLPIDGGSHALCPQ